MLSAPRDDGGALAPVRLSDVPYAIRLRAGQKLIDAAVEGGDLMESVQIRQAVEIPSDRVYWLPARAVRGVAPVRVGR